MLYLTFKSVFDFLNFSLAILCFKLGNLELPLQVMRILKMLLFHLIHLFFVLNKFLPDYLHYMGIILVYLRLFVSLGAVRT